MTEHELQSRLQNLENDLSRLKQEQQVFDFEHREVQAFFEEYDEKKTSLEEQQRILQRNWRKSTKIFIK